MYHHSTPRPTVDTLSDLPSWHTKTLPSSSSSPSPRLADSKWIPTKRLSRLVGRRPLMALIAFGTSFLTLGMFILTRRSDAPDGWTYYFTPGHEPVLYHLSPNAPDTPAPPPMNALAALSGDCLEAWVADGVICSDSDQLRRNMAEFIPIDSVWTWVNGSDPRHSLERAFWEGKPVNHSIYVPRPVRDPDEIEEDYDKRHLVPRATFIGRLWQRLSNTGARPKNSPGVTGKKSAKWFRDHDELRYSVRSVRSHLPTLRKTYILAADFQHPFKDPSNGQEILNYDNIYSDILMGDSDEERAGQWPQWLDPHSQWTRKDGEDTVSGGVGVYHHWDFFKLPTLLRAHEDENAWRHKVLPTFNSFAIETQLMNLPGLTETFIYNNDDFFVGRDLSTADFYTPLFGPVFRMQGNLLVDPIEVSKADTSGEWPQLHRSNWLLSERFGARKRPYIVHATKTFVHPLLHETKLMFPEPFSLTESHRFRGQGHDVVAIFLEVHLTVERHREALLWSFFMGRVDRDGDGFYDADEKKDILAILSDGKWNGKELKVVTPKRATLSIEQSNVNEVLDAVGFPRKKETTYSYSSRDGYPYSGLGTKNRMQRQNGATFASNWWPDVYRVNDPADHESCTLSLPQCFPELSSKNGREKTNAGVILKRFAFDKVECGDCLIEHLMNLSGDRGMSAFLPPQDSFFPPAPPRTDNQSEPVDRSTPTQPPTAFLPVESIWRDINYSLQNVQAQTGWPADRSRREFAMNLIQRYSYVMGESAVEFFALRSNTAAEKDLQKMRRVKPAFACVNDDIMLGQWRVDQYFAEWLRETFSERLPYEL